MYIKKVCIYGLLLLIFFLYFDFSSLVNDNAFVCIAKGFMDKHINPNISRSVYHQKLSAVGYSLFYPRYHGGKTGGLCSQLNFITAYIDVVGFRTASPSEF